MADVPMVADSGLNPSGASFPGSNFLRAASGMPLVRQATLLFAIAGSVALAIAAVLWMQTPDYRPLAGIASAYQANEVVGVLESTGIDYRLDDRTCSSRRSGSRTTKSGLARTPPNSMPARWHQIARGRE